MSYVNVYQLGVTFEHHHPGIIARALPKLAAWSWGNLHQGGYPNMDGFC